MEKKIAPALLNTLRLVAKGYKHEVIANELAVKKSTIDTYIKRLKERFEDEPELRDPNLSSESGLLIFARRYFNSSEEHPPTSSKTNNLSAESREGNKDDLSEQWQKSSLSPDLFDFLNDFSNRIYQVSLVGNSRISVQMADELSRFLTQKERNVSSVAALESLLKVHADILFYQGKTLTDIKFPHEIFASNMPIIKHLRDIAKTCEDGEIFGLANHLLGANYYHIDKRNVSIRAYSRSLETITNKHRRLEAMRALAINYALLNEPNEFKKIENQAGELIEEVSESDQLLDLECATMTLEGLGRAQGLLKLSESFDTLQWGEEIHKKIETKFESLPIRAIQLLKSKLVMVQNLEPTNKTLLEKIGNEGIALARDFEYARHGKFIQKILEESL